jgi:hypothetical protein
MTSKCCVLVMFLLFDVAYLLRHFEEISGIAACIQAVPRLKRLRLIDGQLLEDLVSKLER